MSWRTKGGHDVPTLAGIGVVAVAAAVLSFASLQALAERAGYVPGLAALLPIAIDAQAVVATRAWLAADTPEAARRYARGLALTAVALSVIGNAGEHSMAAAGTVAAWWVVVLISAVPPVALAATTHLGALLTVRSDRAEAVDPIPSTTRAATVAAGRSIPADAGSSTAAGSGADSVGELRESRPKRGSVPPPAARSMDQLRAEFAAAVESPSIEIDPGSAESIRRALRCSPKRARQLRDEHATRPLLAVVGDER